MDRSQVSADMCSSCSRTHLTRSLMPAHQDVRIYSHNIAKNHVYLDVLLNELKDDFDVLFIQEPPWRLIRMTVSSSDKEGEPVIGAPTHPDWLQMVRPPTPGANPRVMAYV